MESLKTQESIITAVSSEGVELRGILLRMSRYAVVFELYRQGSLLQTSEVLGEFKIFVQDRLLYSGRAVVKSLIDTGLMMVCEASLNDSWNDVELVDNGDGGARVRAGFDAFIRQWQKHYKIQPEYKLVAADMNSFLTDARLWIEQVELGIRASPTGDRLELEHELGASLSEAVFPYLDSLFEKLESLAAGIPDELAPVHQVYIRRQLHPLVLCAPFAFRVVSKPLGYAGDYEMVNMILRDPHQGGSLFAKVLNRWFIKQPPAVAHRNRIDYLTQKLAEETVRVASGGRVLRVFNVGCGPAWEIQRLLAEHPIADQAHFTLLDFNDETLQHARGVLEEARQRHHRRTPFEYIRKSVVQLLKARSKHVENPAETKYDFVYCAGLFDYLPDVVCKQLTSIFYDMVAPGGLLVLTNVDPSNPIRHWLGYVLEWHLIYRSGSQLLRLAPESAAPDACRAIADATGVNVFLEVRKPPA